MTQESQRITWKYENELKTKVDKDVFKTMYFIYVDLLEVAK